MEVQALDMKIESAVDQRSSRSKELYIVYMSFKVFCGYPVTLGNQFTLSPCVVQCCNLISQLVHSCEGWSEYEISMYMYLRNMES